MFDTKRSDIDILLALSALLGAYSLKEGNLYYTIIVFLSAAFILIAVYTIIVYQLKKRNLKKYLGYGIREVNLMSGEQFEKFLLIHFQQLGYKGKLTPATNYYGADIVLKKDHEVIVVQAKRWNKKVGIEAVQQIIGAKGFYNANKCIVATNNYFTSSAVNLAISNSVELWDRDKIINLIKKYNRKEIVIKVLKDTEERRCPLCGNKLVLRKGKYGSFYGCSNYPMCKYTNKSYDN